MAKLTDAQLLAAIAAEEEAAIGTLQGDIATDRADAIDRYLGKPYGDEQAGRSSVVSRDVADVVDGVLANVIKPFVSGDKIVQFDPESPEDEERAEQETDYINFVALERNNGFHSLTSAVKDALLLRNGYLVCEWAKRDDVRIERYANLSDEEMAALSSDEAVEIVQHTEVMGAIGPMHEVMLRRKRPVEYCDIMPCPCDQILVGDRTSGPSVQDADFVQLRHPVTISYLRQQGYDIPDDISDSDTGETVEDMARQRFGMRSDLYSDETSDPARRIVLFKKSYIRIDRDGDGIAELRKVCVVGTTILDDDETDLIPIACFTGALMPHQHLGLSIYDMIVDIAKLKTALLRQFMDNKYLANNARVGVNMDRITDDTIPDLLTARPGGIVRFNGLPGEAMMPMQTPDTGTSALQALEYLDSIRENRTGYTRTAQGLGSDSLTSNTATGAIQQLSQSQLRLEMIARTIAETGVRDLFRIVHAVTLKHGSKAEKVQLRNKWVLIDPRTWFKRTDVSITVGLGTGNAEQQFAKLMQMAPMVQAAQAAQLAGPQEMYNYGAELWRRAGYKNPDQFITAPKRDPQTGQVQMPPPPPNPLVQVEQIKQQGLAAKAQGDMQMRVQELQLQDQQHQRQAAIDAQLKREQQMADLELQRSNDQRQAELDARKFAFDMELEDKKLAQQKEIEAMKIAGQLEAERIKAGLDDGMRTAQAMLEQAGMQANAIINGMREAAQGLGTLMQQHAAAMQAANVPKRIVRDPVTGRAQGIEPVRH